MPTILTTAGYLDSTSAYALDQDLFSTCGYTIPQLMDLTGLFVSQAIFLSLLPSSPPP